MAKSIYSRVDKPLLLAFLAALSVGLIMVASASVNFAHEQQADQLYFFKRHLVYLVLGISIAIVAIRVPLSAWYLLSPYLLMGAIALLALVLIPGIGLRVNGSQRWLNAGPLTLQVSELAKIGLILFLAGYLVRRGDDLRRHWYGFAVPAGLLMLMVMLLILEPDFGSVVVITGVTCALLFLAGIPLGVFLGLAATGIAALSFFALSSPYRMQRITAFVDPWADQFNSGYQLTQALIAFGRGEWFGVGLGNSLQKLFYLPEAHTDFVFAVIAEETGLVGAVLLIVLLWTLGERILRIGRRCIVEGQGNDVMRYAGYLVSGVGLLFLFQCFINIGVSCGLLPTKGLTLPFISYGGSSVLVWSALLALVLRADWERRQLGEREADK